MPNPPSNDSGNVMLEFEQSSRNNRSIIPFYLCIPVLAWLIFDTFVAPIHWDAFLFGALGWIIALMLRAPIGLLTAKLPRKKSHFFIIASSGPLEEGVRLCMVALVGTSLPSALSIGQGWAAIEIIYTIMTLLMVASLARRQDEKAQQAKAMLLQQQGNRIIGPFWGVLERITASAFHIGATLLIAYNPVLIILLLPLHSLLNLGMTRLAKRSIIQAESVVAVIGIAALVCGLAVFGVL